MSSPDILNCRADGEVSFLFECPQTWDAMEETDDPRRRHCTHCSSPVTLCHDANEAALRADQQECIAVPAWLAAGLREAEDGPRRLIIGQADSTRERMTRIVEVRAAQSENE